MKMTKGDRDKIINTIAERYAQNETVTSNEVASVADEFGFDYLPYSVLKDARASRGNFYVAKLMKMAGVMLEIHGLIVIILRESMIIH